MTLHLSRVWFTSERFLCCDTRAMHGTRGAETAKVIVKDGPCVSAAYKYSERREESKDIALIEVTTVMSDNICTKAGCTKVFDTAAKLATHKRNVHLTEITINGEKLTREHLKAWKCRVCEELFLVTNTFRTHYKTYHATGNQGESGFVILGRATE
jgi:hypothetical protein